MLGYDLANAKLSHAGSEVLAVVVMKSPIFWDITPCSPLKVKQRDSKGDITSLCYFP
jgi:hypothetical protein